MPLNLGILHALLDYNPTTGELIWKPRGTKQFDNRYAGQLAGCVHKVRGHIYIDIEGRSYLAHRVIWLMMTGEWPEFQIDHRDTNRANNVWKNLRSATHNQNQHNAARRKDNTSGYKGVSRVGLKWKATIMCDRKNVYLGLYGSPKEAHMAYIEKADELHGEFARVS